MSYSSHLVFAGSLGASLGYLGHLHFGFSQPLCMLAAGICTLGGLLPDLDRLNEDANSTIRELFSLVAAGGAMLLMRRLQFLQLEGEQLICAMGGVFLVVRYGFLQLVKQLSVHRGMFHSIPATGIAGLAVYLMFHSPDSSKRIFLAVAVMVGFLSHLLLDQFGVNTLAQAREKADGVVGSTLKLYSRSKWATGLCYSILGGMGYLTKMDSNADASWRDDLDKVVQIGKNIEAEAAKYKSQAGEMLPDSADNARPPVTTTSRRREPARSVPGRPISTTTGRRSARSANGTCTVPPRSTATRPDGNRRLSSWQPARPGGPPILRRTAKNAGIRVPFAPGCRGTLYAKLVISTYNTETD